MTERRPVRRAAAVLALAAAIAVPGVASVSGEDAEPGFHADAVALERAAVDTYRAVLRDDVAAIAASAARIVEAIPADPPGPDDRHAPLAGTDRGFRAALGAVVEAARAGDLKTAASQQYWIGEGCRRCHEKARFVGLMDDPPIAPPE